MRGAAVGVMEAGRIAGPWFITPHAVRRYIERVRPYLSYERALAEIVDQSQRAHRVRVDERGLEHWRGPSPRRLRFRVQPGGEGAPQLVTVLPAFDGYRPR